MRRAHLAALARDPSGGIRAVLRGAIGDNEAGAVFGLSVAPGVYFYVTT
jgi:hypothetical protein